MRIGLIAILQESNTFIAQQTTLDHFRRELLVSGPEMRTRLAGTPHEVGGMFHALDELGAEAVPIFAARAHPFGVLERSSAEELVALLMAALEPLVDSLDGILVAPHGATVSEPWPDFDGHWLSLVRQRLGPGKPIVGTLDPHGNLSPQMVAACDSLVAYRTNPHLDQWARGIDAARTIVRTLQGKLRPTMAAAFPPLAINIEKQHTAEEPCLSLYRLADEQLHDDRVLSNSIMLGFPYADVPEMGASLIVVTNNDLPLAQKLADELAAYLWEHRHDFDGRLLDTPAALDEAALLPKPVCLLDMGDNVGGGSPADGTIIALELHRRRTPRALVCLSDPAAVQAAVAAGVGARLELSLGGNSDNLHGPPLVAPVTVISLHEGKFSEPQPRHGGYSQFDQGLTAVVRTDHDLTLVLTTLRMPPFSLGQITSCDLNPADFDYLVAKGVNAPVAAYREVCPSFVRVNTPGCTTADLRQLPYKHRRKPLFPLEDQES